MSRELRKVLFEETKDMVSCMDIEPKVVGFTHYTKETVPTCEKYISKSKEYNKSRVIFEKMDTISAALKHKQNSLEDKPEVDFLVFASSKHYGGGIWNGAKAQEEDIFLCTDLFMLKNEVEEEYYPLNGILAVDCHIVSDNNYTPLDKEVYARAFFAPAPNLNKNMNDPKSDIDFYTRMCNLTEATLDYSSNSTLILGAWGCGVFKNDPEKVAEMFKKIITLLFEDYKKIVIAILDDEVLNIFKTVIMS